MFDGVTDDDEDGVGAATGLLVDDDRSNTRIRAAISPMTTTTVAARAKGTHFGSPARGGSGVGAGASRWTVVGGTGVDGGATGAVPDGRYVLGTGSVTASFAARANDFAD